MYQIYVNHIKFNFKSLEVVDHGSETELKVTIFFNLLAPTSQG